MKYRPDILVIDDDPVTIEALCPILKDAGFRVQSAGDGVSGLELALSGKFRVVIMDWMLPDVPGTELCHRIRRAELNSYIYVIMLSQRSRRSDIVEGLGAGADDYVTKPVTPGEVLARLNTAERILSLITRDVTIFALAKLAESRDPETGAHLERVRHYSRTLARHMAELPEYSAVIDDTFIHQIFQTAPLHDIGKVAIPDRVLLKAGRLNAEEFALMKTHATRGAETLDAALRAHPEASHLEMARDIALCHHERFDGQGYPQGLSGRSIPLAARIVSVADAYDAMTSRRVYKVAYTHDSARESIYKERGGQFDPDVVDAFMLEEREFCRIRQSFADDQCVFLSPDRVLGAA